MIRVVCNILTLQVLFTASGADRYYVADGFVPYTLNTFKIEACNSIGCVNSSDAVGRTGEAGILFKLDLF